MTNVLTKPQEALGTLGAQARKDSMAEKSFSELYRLHVNNIYYYLLSRVRNEADAEDLTSQTFITALEKRHRLRDAEKFTPWLYSIARNKANDYFRRAARRSMEPLDESNLPSLPTTPHKAFETEERLMDLDRLIEQLSPIEQEYLRLRLIADLPFAEIAKILRQNESKVKKSYYRLLERLQAQVE